MGFFSDGDAKGAIGLLGSIVGGNSGGLGRAGGKRRRPSESKVARGVTAGFILGRSAASKHLHSDGKVLVVDGQVLAKRKSVASDTLFPGRSGRDEVQICVPEVTRGKKELVTAANTLLRTIRAGISVRTDREHGEALISAGRGPGKVFWPGSCVKVVINKKMAEAAADEMFAIKSVIGGEGGSYKDVKKFKQGMGKWRAAAKRLKSAAVRARKAAERAAKAAAAGQARAAAKAAKAALAAAKVAQAASATVQASPQAAQTRSMAAAGFLLAQAKQAAQAAATVAAQVAPPQGEELRRLITQTAQAARSRFARSGVIRAPRARGRYAAFDADMDDFIRPRD